MKKPAYVLLTSLAFSSVSFASGVMPLKVSFQGRLPAVHEKATVVPGLLVSFGSKASSRNQMLLLDQSVAGKLAVTRTVYVPHETRAIKGMVALVEKHHKSTTRYFYYCRNNAPLDMLTSRKHTHLMVKVKNLKSIHTNNSNAALALNCDYRVSASEGR